MEERERQKLFLDRMQKVRKEAQENKNTVTEEELEEKFGDLGLTGEQMQQVRDFLKAGGIVTENSAPFEDVITQEEHNYLDDYRTMIDSIELPSEGVLDAVKLSAMAGEKDAQRRLTEYSLSKVLDIAKLYAGQGVYLEDLIGAGNEALAVGVTLLGPLESPDEVDGFLGKRIMDAMEDLVSENIDAKATEKMVEERVNLVADRARELATVLGRKVSVGELAAEYEMDQEDILEAMRLSANAIKDIGK